MSETIFPTFPSAFENSVLGPYWEVENRSYGQDTNIVPDGGNPINEHDILTIRYKPYDTHERYYSQAAHPLGVRSFIQLKTGSGVTPLGGKTLELKTYSGFDSTVIEEVYGVKIGEFLIKSENTPNEDKSHVEKLVQQHLNWIFSEDIEGKDKYYKVFYDKAILYYTLQKEGSPNSVWADLMKLVGITIAQLWAEALKYLANQIRERFKITNFNYWNPYNDDGTQNKSYMPIFFPSGQTFDKGLTEFGIKFNAISVFTTDVPQVIKIGSSSVHKGNDLLRNVFVNGVQSLKNDLFQSIKAVADLSAQLLNAFFVGLYNGVIEIVAGTLEIIGQLLKLGDPKVRAKILEAIKWVFTYIKQEGIINTLVETFKILTLEYREGKNIYEILKTLGEDLAEIIVAIILAYFTGGVTVFQKIKQFVTALKELAQKMPKGAYEEFREAVDKLKRKFKGGDDQSNLDKSDETTTDNSTNDNDKNKTKRTPNRYKKVPLNHTKLGKIAVEYRRRLSNPTHGGNIAVFEYINPETQRLETKVFSTDPAPNIRTHAEKFGFDWFKEQGIPTNNIKGIYSENAPCEFNGHRCKNLIDDGTDGIIVEYSYEYPGVGNDNDTPEIKELRKSEQKRKDSELNEIFNK